MFFTLDAGAVLLLITLNVALANHIRSGDVTQYGEFESYEGLREFHTTAHIKRPVLCWEDLEAEGIAVESCTPEKIAFSGQIDESDFGKGIVMTFPKEDYVALGCPLPPQTDYLSKVDQIVFREIVRSVSKKDIVVVKTNYISGALVVPAVELHVGSLVSADRRLSPAFPDLLSLDPVSHTNNLGATLFKRKGSRAIFRGAKVDWRFSITVGVCEFKFDRLKLRVTWEQRLSADCSATVDFRRKLKRAKSGLLFKTAIPRAGFSLTIFLVGQITFGLSAGVGYEAKIETGAAATVRFNAGLRAGQKVTVGIRKFSFKTLSSKGSRGKGPLSFRFKKPVTRAKAFAKGFIGLRPFIEAGLDLPLVGDAIVNAGGTVGINANVRFDSTPFKPVRKGKRIGVCRGCHSVRGTIDLEGRRLSVSGKVPLLERKERVIREKFLDFRVGVLCLFRRKCPSRF